jgi:2-oxoglutarate dehydrogenase E1 component
LSDLAKGSFQTVISEVDEKIDAKKVKRIIACSGKVYYDLINARTERAQTDTAIIRIEQLYPFPHKTFAAELKKFPNFTELVWAQDEPQNQGAWFQIQHNIFENMESGQKLAYAGRPASASPAVGYYDKHYAQQKALLDTAFSKLKGFVLTK